MSESLRYEKNIILRVSVKWMCYPPVAITGDVGMRVSPVASVSLSRHRYHCLQYVTLYLLLPVKKHQFLTETVCTAIVLEVSEAC